MGCLEQVDKKKHAALSCMFNRGTTQLEEAVAARFA